VATVASRVQGSHEFERHGRFGAIATSPPNGWMEMVELLPPRLFTVVDVWVADPLQNRQFTAIWAKVRVPKHTMTYDASRRYGDAMHFVLNGVATNRETP